MRKAILATIIAQIGRLPPSRGVFAFQAPAGIEWPGTGSNCWPSGVTQQLSGQGHRCGPDHSEGVASRGLGRPSAHEGGELASVPSTAQGSWAVPRCRASAVVADQARGPVTRRVTGAVGPGWSRRRWGRDAAGPPRPGPHQVTSVPSRRTRSFRGKRAPGCSPGAKQPSSPSCAG